MRDPFNPGVAVGKIVLTGTAGTRQEMVAGDYLPMETASGYMIRAAQRRVVGRHEEAADDYNRALSLEPRNREAYFEQGLTYVAMKKKKAAIAAFEAVISLAEAEDCCRSTIAKQWIDKLSQQA